MPEPEVEPDLIPPTTIFKHILPALPKKEAIEVVQQIEDALASGSKWCNERHYFLENSERHAFDAAHNRLEAGKFKISPKKMREIARLGLVCAYQEKIVTAKQIGALVDDIASLWLLASILGEAEFGGNLSPVWGHAFDLSPAEEKEILRDVKEEQEVEDLMYKIYQHAKKGEQNKT
ncbi:MAG: hypothetical protein V1807_01790 [Patescibacteria group bacterium]